MKAAIYCRLSKEDALRPGGESESIRNQRSMLVRYALDHGYTIAHIYADEDYSGIDRSRPAFLEMLAAAQRREFDIILAKTQSRFTRDMELVEKYLHGKFPEWGIRFVAVVDHVDTEDAAAKKARQINGLINEWYLEDLSANVRAVLDHKRRKGEYIASFCLYGYQKDPACAGHILPDPEAAAVVREIYALYLAGCGCARIARILNERGVPSPTHYKQLHNLPHRPPAQGAPLLWSKATVSRILSNRTYAGDMEQGRQKKLSYKSQRVVRLPRDKWITVPATHEPLIPPSAFANVQAMRQSRARSGSSGVTDPLAGLVVCGLCGCRMERTSSGSGAVHYYRCRTALRSRAACRGQAYIPAADLHTMLLQAIRAHQMQYALPPMTALTRSAAAALLQAAVVYPPQQNRRQIELHWQF